MSNIGGGGQKSPIFCVITKWMPPNLIISPNQSSYLKFSKFSKILIKFPSIWYMVGLSRFHLGQKISHFIKAVHFYFYHPLRVRNSTAPEIILKGAIFRWKSGNWCDVQRRILDLLVRLLGVSGWPLEDLQKRRPGWSRTRPSRRSGGWGRRDSGAWTGARLPRSGQ